MTPADKHTKAFTAAFDSLRGMRSRWEVWQDFIQIVAIEISSVTDKVNAPERAKIYQGIVTKYSKKERETIARMLVAVIAGVDENPDQDFLGMQYMLCELSSGHTGQFFTPYNISHMLAELSFDEKMTEEKYGFTTINEPSCGAGANLIAFANACKRRGICYHDRVLFIAQDLDYIVGLTCYIQLSLLGCAGYVVIGDTLAAPALSRDEQGLLPAGPQNRIWYTPLFSSDVWIARRKIAEVKEAEKLLWETKPWPNGCKTGS